MSYAGQTHHPHIPGHPPNPHLIPLAHAHDAQQPYVPAGLELVQAHWFVRHGERARESANFPAFDDLEVVFPSSRLLTT